MSDYWKKVMDGQGKGDRKGKGAGKTGSSSSAKRDPSTGRFKPRHGTYMVNNGSTTVEGTNASELWNQAEPAHIPVPDENPSAQYTFVDGVRESVSFAWPSAAPHPLAREMIIV